MAHPKISIIIPIYNVEDHLEKCLQSILKQTFSEFEAILVNDGSTDRSESLIKKYIRQDSRFRYFSQVNAGPSSARNLGIKKAEAAYLTFIDADDWVTDDYLEKLVEPMLALDVDLVCAGYFEVNSTFPQGIRLHDFQKDFLNRQIPKQSFQANLFKGTSGVLWAKLFKKEILHENEILLHPKLRFSEDLLAVLEYSKFVKKVFVVSDAIYYYNRLEDDGLSGKLTVEKFKNLTLLFREIDKYKDELKFLDLESIKNMRISSFAIQLLKDHSTSKMEFYKVADFIVRNISVSLLTMPQKKKYNSLLLKGISRGYYYPTWGLVRLHQILKRMRK